VPPGVYPAKVRTDCSGAVHRRRALRKLGTEGWLWLQIFRRLLDSSISQLSVFFEVFQRHFRFAWSVWKLRRHVCWRLIFCAVLCVEEIGCAENKCVPWLCAMSPPRNSFNWSDLGIALSSPRSVLTSLYVHLDTYLLLSPYLDYISSREFFLIALFLSFI
jgi:hypothetical protein